MAPVLCVTDRLSRIASVEESPVDRVRQPHQRMAQVDDLAMSAEQRSGLPDQRQYSS
jgi:oligoribonuclease (3'-5' exoribonuclease)